MHPASWITALADLLSDRHVELTILTASKDIRPESVEYNLQNYKLIVVKIPNHRWNLLTLFRSQISKIGVQVKKICAGYDIIHVHGTEHHYLSSAFNTSLPNVTSIQGLLFKYIDYLPSKKSITYLSWAVSSKIEKKEIKRAQYFTCRTHWDTASVKEINPTATIFPIWEVLRNEFYSVKDFAPGQEILFSGGANPLKNLGRALRNFDAFLTNFESKLNIIGPCSWETIDDLTKKYSLQRINKSNTILHGMTKADGIVRIAARCFCLYHPTLIDNSPNSVCEAQIMGLPAIATNVGGVSSLINHNQTGILLPANEENDALELERLFADKELQIFISRNAKEVARKRHDRGIIADEMMNCYQTVINAKSSSKGI